MTKSKLTLEGKEYEIFHVEGQEKEISDQVIEIWEHGCYELGRRKKDAVYLDLGANVGLSALYFKDWAKVIYAFEPNPHIFECLKKNTEKYENIKIFNCGIGSHRTKEPLYSAHSEELAQNIEGYHRATYTVLCDFYPLDEFMKAHKIDHVDVMKMDVEDCEYYILPSASFGRAAPKIDFIIGEAHFQVDGGFPDIVPPILGEHGYKTKWWAPKDPNFKNCTRFLTYMDQRTGKGKKYTHGYNTIFCAER